MQVRFIHLVLGYKHYLLVHISSLRNVSYDLYLGENGTLMHSVFRMKIMIAAMKAYCLYKITIYSVAILYAGLVFLISLNSSYQFDIPLDQIKHLVIRTIGFEV